MTMPAGKYYVGDLCYVMHDEWDEVCELLFAGRNDHTVNDGEFQLKDGRRFSIYSTKYGDGVYYDNYGRVYDVDAGSIGCILLDDIDLTNTENFLESGNVIEFADDFETGGDRFTSNDWNGIIAFDIVEVDTSPVYDNEFGFVDEPTYE